MEESCGEATIVGSADPNPPPEVNRKRRSIQTKLPWVSQAQGGGDVSDGENKGKTRRKRESLLQGSKKSLPACNEVSKSSKGSGRSCALNKRSPKKKQKQEQDAATLKVRSSKRCKATESKYNGLNDNQKTNAAFKDPTSSGLEWKETSLSSRTGVEFDVTVNLDGRQHLQKPDFKLQLEGNIAVEESIELSTGKQIHQYFTCWEETKRQAKSISISDRENYYHSAHDKDVLGSPIHVFDKVEDESIGFHWQNWVFTPDSDRSCAPKHASSIFESSVKPLELDTACHSVRHLNQILAKTNFTASPVASSSLPEQQNKNELLGQLVTDNVGSNNTSSICLPLYSNCTVDIKTEKDHMLIKERLDSYNLRRGNFPEFSLWTDKYQPENTLELCGNIKSVNVLSEWLKSWDEGPRSNRSFNSFVKDGLHSSYDIESYVDDIDDEAIRKNVVLLTGPTGSGKSAAIHACTKEQGFKVIEVNTSDVRSGALMKQKFGDSIEASAITPSLCLKANPIGERKKIIPSLSSDIVDIDDTDDIFSLRTSENCQQGKIATGNTQKLDEEKNTNSRKVKGSIQVFEDVDVVFCEDMGFISAVLQLAEKTKKPIILTSNDKNPILPHLDPLVVDFTVPSFEDLLSHAQMVCAAEGIHISSELLERLISYCRGDIRKMLLLLQFWCQGTRCQIDDSKRCNYNPLPFDVSAAHLVMPRVIPWDFPCDLSAKIEEEISGSLSLFENLCLEDAKEHMLCTTEMIDSSKIGNYNRNRNRKKSILKQKCSFLECTDFSADADGLEDFLDASDTPGESAQKRVKRRRCIILSSQSDDDPSTDEVLPRENTPVQNGLILHDMIVPINIDANKVCNHARPSSSMVYESKIMDTICDTSGLQDVSFVPESSFASPIDANKEVGSLSLPEYASQTSTDLSDCPLLPVHCRADIDYMNDSVSNSNKPLEDNIGYNCEVHLESVYRDEGIVISHEHEEPQALDRSVVMDEFGHVDSDMLEPIKSSPVRQKWQKLKSCREDLKSCLNSNHKDAYSIIKLSSRLTDLISQTDVMINGCNAVFSDILDSNLMLSDESDDFSRDDRQFEMGSTYAQHGFCFYASECATTGSSFGYQTTVDLAQEMLASSTNVMALGKLLTTPNLSSKGIVLIEAMKIGSVGRELKSELFSAILPKVPTRVSMSLEGPAFLEYAYFMSQISKSVDSRLAETTKEKQGRRFRAPVHYLKSGQYSLASEHVKLLSQSFCFKVGGR